jgi:hypothetical protein
LAKAENSEIPYLDLRVLIEPGRIGNILDNIFAISQVKYKRDGKALEDKCATGFFYKHKEQIYFITNRHVVIDEDEPFYPDELSLELHIDRMDLTKNRVFNIPLYKGDNPLWLEHPEGKIVDVVALPVELPSFYYVTPFSQIDCLREEPNLTSIYVPLGDDLLVVGYPEGLYDSIPIPDPPTKSSIIMGSKPPQQEQRR